MHLMPKKVSFLLLAVDGRQIGVMLSKDMSNGTFNNAAKIELIGLISLITAQWDVFQGFVSL